MMNIEEHYNKIPFLLLERVGFPTNSTWLTDDQQRLLEFIYDEYYKEMYTELQKCREYIEELEDSNTELEDQVIDLQHKLSDLTGEK
jgi:hypothetical protein